MTTLWRAAVLVLLLATPARAALAPDELLPDAALEQRAEALDRTLRCVVCQNESIHDSPAPLARDLRHLVRERIRAGDSDDAIRAFMVQRYGDFILLKPPVAPATWALWFGPPVILAGAVAGMALRRRRPAVPAAPLSPDEQAQVEALLRP